MVQFTGKNRGGCNTPGKNGVNIVHMIPISDARISYPSIHNSIENYIHVHHWC